MAAIWDADDQPDAARAVLFPGAYLTLVWRELVAMGAIGALYYAVAQGQFRRVTFGGGTGAHGAGLVLEAHGLVIHMPLGELTEGDIPARVRDAADVSRPSPSGSRLMATVNVSLAALPYWGIELSVAGIRKSFRCFFLPSSRERPQIKIDENDCDLQFRVRGNCRP